MRKKAVKKSVKNSKSTKIFLSETKTHKGQAMMEYLMTYGLALFVILVVLAILVAVVLPALKPPENCQFTQPGFSCNQKQHRLLSDGRNTTIIFQLDNQFGRSAIVTGVGCSAKVPANVQRSDAPSISPVTLAAGANTVFGAPPASTVGCIGADTAANSNFKGSVVVLYHFADEVATGTGIPERMAVASVSGNVQSSTG